MVHLKYGWTTSIKHLTLNEMELQMVYSGLQHDNRAPTIQAIKQLLLVINVTMH
jgi:hypothetical protein